MEVLDPGETTPYYYNTVTGEVSWENENLKKHNAVVDNSASRDNWIVHYDPTSMKTYYENKITSQTQWECPFPDDGDYNADHLNGKSTIVCLNRNPNC